MVRRGSHDQMVSMALGFCSRGPVARCPLVPAWSMACFTSLPCVVCGKFRYAGAAEFLILRLWRSLRRVPRFPDDTLQVPRPRINRGVGLFIPDWFHDSDRPDSKFPIPPMFSIDSCNTRRVNSSGNKYPILTFGLRR